MIVVIWNGGVAGLQMSTREELVALLFGLAKGWVRVFLLCLVMSF